MDAAGLTVLYHVFLSLFKPLFRWIWRPKEKSVVGETVLITGAAHGMGRCLALKFASLGATVIVVDVNKEGNCETAEMVNKSNAVVYSYTCDLRNREEIKSLAKRVKEDVGDVTILVNNAGVVFPSDILSSTDEMIRTTYDVNVLAHIWLIREFLPEMKRRNHGHILTMASAAAKIAAPYFLDYASSKHAVRGFMNGLRRELRYEGTEGVKVTCAFPGFVSTGFMKEPKVMNKDLFPILEANDVVDKVVHGMLTDQWNVDIPSDTVQQLCLTFLPHETMELLFDAVNPTFERHGQKKED